MPHREQNNHRRQIVDYQTNINEQAPVVDSFKNAVIGSFESAQNAESKIKKDLEKWAEEFTTCQKKGLPPLKLVYKWIVEYFSDELLKNNYVSNTELAQLRDGITDIFVPAYEEVWGKKATKETFFINVLKHWRNHEYNSLIDGQVPWKFLSEKIQPQLA